MCFSHWILVRFGSVRIHVLKLSSGSARFDLIFKRAVRVRFGSIRLVLAELLRVWFDLNNASSVEPRVGNRLRPYDQNIVRITFELICI
jgi:hypothetical protein